jgi:hypothetical protein
MTRTSLLPAALACAILGTVPSFAQQPKEPDVPTQPAPPKLDPRACADRDRLTTGDAHESDGAAPRDEEHLSDKLARTDGVICPPAGLDPQIRSPAPDGGGNMPVIPPPGSPGGDPNVRPK